MGLMPKQTKAENKLMWGFTLTKLIGVVITILVATLLGNSVHKYLKIPFIIFCVCCFLILQVKAPTNPEKNFFQDLKIIFLIFCQVKNITV